eukprot:scaffold19097_cov30-Attheya_sp.AAC.1
MDGGTTVCFQRTPQGRSHQIQSCGVHQSAVDAARTTTQTDADADADADAEAFFTLQRRACQAQAQYDRHGIGLDSIVCSSMLTTAICCRHGGTKCACA